MRRRLLLIVGWLVAVVGSGLVASGAVAVAGGQVTDRPLRPLSAAEVAALPVAPVFDRLALASGGTAQTPATSNEVATTTGDQPDDGDGAAAAGDPRFVVRPDREPVATPLDPPPVTVPPDPIGEPRLGISEGSIFQLEGGTVAIGGNADAVLLLWATPHAGFRASVQYVSDTELSVSFTNVTVNYGLRAWWSDEGLQVTTSVSEIR